MTVTQVSALFYYSYHAKEFLILAYLFGNSWGILFFLAIVYILKNKAYCPIKWFISQDSIETRLTLTMLILTSSSCIIYLVLILSLNERNKVNPLSIFIFLVCYSLVSVIITKLIARHLLRPFELIQSYTTSLISRKSPITQPNTLGISEFDYLQKIIYERFNEHIIQSMEIESFAKKAMQVAHDIRSPASAIMMLTKDNSGLPEDQRIALRNASVRVQDIANNLLSEYSHSENGSTKKTTLLSTTIMSVVSEKRLQFNSDKIEFEIQIDKDCYFSSCKSNIVNLKRSLSNILNNSIESIPANKKGKIIVKLKSTTDKIAIIIQDNGIGIEEHTIKKLNSTQEVTSSKRQGYGLGIKQVLEFIKNENAQIEFSSNQVDGTQVTLELNRAKTPCWFPEKIYLNNDTHIIILDDDNAIHAAWDIKLSHIKFKFSSIKVDHFSQADTCINYIKMLTEREKSKILLLTDYELMNQKINGLDVVKLTGVKKSIIVTSYFENEQLIGKAILQNSKILPKTIAADIELAQKEPITPCNIISKAILVDDQESLNDIITFIAKSKSKKIQTYSNPYCLWENLHNYTIDTKIFLDYNLDLPITGIDIANQLYENGYINLFLATGDETLDVSIPNYLVKITEKLALLNYLE